MSLLVERTLKRINIHIWKDKSLKSDFMAYRYKHSDAFQIIVNTVFRNDNLSQSQLNILRDIFISRVPTNLRQHGYWVTLTENRFIVSWSKSHILIRRILKKYTHCRLEEWLTPPNGRLYLKAETEFNTLLVNI